MTITRDVFRIDIMSHLITVTTQLQIWYVHFHYLNYQSGFSEQFVTQNFKINYCLPLFLLKSVINVLACTPLTFSENYAGH